MFSTRICLDFNIYLWIFLIFQAGQGGIPTQNNQVPAVPPGASPAPQGPPHDLNSQALPPGSTQQGTG